MYILAKERKERFSKKGKCQAKNILLVANLSLLSKDFPVTSLPEMEVTAHLFCLHCQHWSTSIHVIKWQKTFTFFAHVHFSSLLTKLRFCLWKYVCVLHHLENCGMWAAAQPDPAIWGCSQNCSHLRQNQLLLVQLCNQPCILWLCSFLTPRAVFTLQENALCKAFMSCSLSNAEAGLSGQHLTYTVSPSKVLSSLYERQAFSQFPKFLRTLTFLHKMRLSLRVFSLLTGMCLIFSQLLSFLLIFPYWP